MWRAAATVALATGLLGAPVLSLPGEAATPDRQARISLAGKPQLPVAKAGPQTRVVEDGVDIGRPGPVTNPKGPGSDRDAVVTLPVSAGGLVGLTWPRGRKDPVTDLAIRTRTGDTWGDWQVVEPAPGEDESARGPKRPATEPIWVGSDVAEIQVRVAPGQAGALGTAELFIYTPGRSATPTQPAARANAATAPTIITRSQWGANEALRNGCVPSIGDTTRAATVHHTAGANSYTAAESAGIVRGILSYHTQALGWCDIGYNALVDKYGQIFEGRIGGLSNPVIGAHTLGFNARNFGVSVLGEYTSAPISDAALDSLAAVIAMRFNDFYIDPATTTTLTSRDDGSRFPYGTVVTVPRINGHRDFFSTSCPGQALYGQLDQLRAKVAARITYQSSALYAHYLDLGGPSTMGEIGMGEQVLFGHQHLGYASGWGTWSIANGWLELGPGFDRYYAATGSAAWGDPTAEKAITGGARVDFPASSVALVWSPKYGTGLVVGAIRGYWEAKGGLTSWIGFPVEWPASQPNGGVSQQFSFGKVWWSSATGAFTTYGAVGSTYAARGVTRLGYPTSEEQPVAPTGARQAFQQGWIYWSSTTGGHTAGGRIHDAWLAAGGATKLGFPIDDEQRTSATGTGQDFQLGTYFQSTTTPAVVTYQGVHSVYALAGGPGGCLGYPTAPEAPTASGSIVQPFQRGTITFPVDGSLPTWTCTG